jgi:SAM-dependent methyltransferase
LTGNFLLHDFSSRQESFSLIYWNDVFEHIPPDEILDYLSKIHDLLVPGGLLVTITPNWHMRPKDATKFVFPPRTEASGLHLREYTLRDVSQLLHEAGYKDVHTPLFVTPGRVCLAGRGMVAAKQRWEPVLERLPFWLAKACCLWLGLGVTLAHKPE